MVLQVSDKLRLKPHFLSAIGDNLLARFRRSRNTADLDNGALAYDLAIQLLPVDDVDYMNFLHDTGISSLERYHLTGNLEDINQAISKIESVVKSTPDTRGLNPGWLNNLGLSFRHRFEHTGDLVDISEAISYQQRAVQLTHVGHASLPTRLTNLGNSLQGRFERTGDLSDIFEAISAHQEAIHLTPEGHANTPGILNNLGNSVLMHFQHTADHSNIPKAIISQQKAVQLTPEGHAHMPSFLTTLGFLFHRHFECTGNPFYLSKAISTQQKVVQITHERDTRMPRSLNNLGGSLQRRFEQTGDLADICEAILYEQRAVQLTPAGHAILPAWLSNLGISLRRRFEHTGDLADISEAISVQKKAIRLTPDGDAKMPSWLNNLGSSFQSRFERIGNQADAHEAIFNYRQSATYLSGSPSVRLDGATHWAQLSNKIGSLQLLEAYSTAIQLVSLVAGLDQTIQKRYTSLKQISAISASASAAALKFGKNELALEWLEQGRCLVWTQLNDLRTPLYDLRVHNPNLADDILRVSRALEIAGSRAEDTEFEAQTGMTSKLTRHEQATAHVKLAQEWDRLLIEVREIPQFKDFLRPTPCSTLLKHIPDSGVLVLINIHEDRSDALVLISGIQEPLHIALDKFPYDKAEYLRNSLKLHLLSSGVRMRGSEPDTRGMRYESGSAVIIDVLRQLWVFVVKPILNGLGYSGSPANIQRIWWCVTGPLAFLPIHAAGIYGPSESASGTYSTLSDFAVSSYTPTVRALVEMTHRSQEHAQEKNGLFMVSQPDTPTLARIPGTTKEVRAVELLLKIRGLRHLCLEGGAATVTPVITNISAYSCVHFACHASQNTDEPLKTGFYLHDGRLELRSIIKERLIGADLAFLSACQTCTGDEKLSEEAVHLAAGMLAAGYRGVVATMWSIQDRYGPKIAEDFYEYLVRRRAEDDTGSERLSGDRAARALHYATQQMRKTLGDSEESLLTWVPYVHFGL
ncbi:hypothetical protein GALMADRAFT_80422 [Galerina marginata CBS 339.88]|uniref:CHAT domain-containing protein n=1 Tax=Galerina marginata (strain CBS 339.88) TaxID=685588 RepID=A0A067S7F4_GALM3|nr:hypothetical protein GALMADRAFT_80422 [Galerina marginata CBS 339.88]